MIKRYMNFVDIFGQVHENLEVYEAVDVESIIAERDELKKDKCVSDDNDKYIKMYIRNLEKDNAKLHKEYDELKKENEKLREQFDSQIMRVYVDNKNIQTEIDGKTIKLINLEFERLQEEKSKQPEWLYYNFGEATK